MKAFTTALALALAAAVAGLSPVRAADPVKPARAEIVDRYIGASWKGVDDAWRARLVQDETQKVCTAIDNAPDNATSEAIRTRERARIEYPADGKLMGDWKKGQKLAQDGYGGRFTDRTPNRENGGNCYACHQLSPQEIAYGTLGPSLREYGKIRKFADAEVKAVYDKIYNSQAVVACSQMPRFGAGKFLSIEQIKDIVAYVMSPDSPVNK